MPAVNTGLGGANSASQIDQTAQLPIETPVEEPKGKGEAVQAPIETALAGASELPKDDATQSEDTAQQGGPGKPNQSATGGAISGAEQIGNGHDRAHNHGWYVSQAAHNGDDVSQVAQSDIGKKHFEGQLAGDPVTSTPADPPAISTTANLVGGGPNDAILALVDQIIALATTLSATNPELKSILDQMTALRTALGGATGGGAVEVPKQTDVPVQTPEVPVQTPELPKEEVVTVPVVTPTPELPKEEVVTVPVVVAPKGEEEPKAEETVPVDPSAQTATPVVVEASGPPATDGAAPTLPPAIAMG